MYRNKLNIMKNLLLKIILKVMTKLLKVNSKRIMFIAYHGKGYLCNPKYIHIEISKDKRFDGFDLIWALNKTSEKINDARIVKYRSFKYFYLLCTSKYWVSNCKLPSYYVKKKNQIYIQTWHGTPLKKLASDIENNKNKTFYRSEISWNEMIKSYDIDTRRYNYFISPNKYSTEIFKRCFKLDENIIKEIGYPRNDRLKNLSKKDINKIKEKFKIKNKKIILYTPTWRDNQYNFREYTLDIKIDFYKWREKLGKEWVVLFKPHYLIKMKYDYEDLKDFVYIIDENIDITDLYIISDVLVTDYSSTFFDYGILERPIYFYMYDRKEYEEEIRGFYLDVDKDLPGPIFEDEELLIEAINNNLKYSYKNDKFLDNIKEFTSISSKSIVEEIFLDEIVK